MSDGTKKLYFSTYDVHVLILDLFIDTDNAHQGRSYSENGKITIFELIFFENYYTLIIMDGDMIDFNYSII